MAVFVGVGKITDKGMTGLKEGFRGRHQQAVRRAEQQGAKVLASYALMGPYDFLVLLDCPGAATAMRVLTSEASGCSISWLKRERRCSTEPPHHRSFRPSRGS